MVAGRPKKVEGGRKRCHRGIMTKVQWLCALSLLFLVGGSLYSWRSGSVTAGPFSYSRRENPVRFYIVVGALFAVGAACIVLVGATYGTSASGRS